MSKKHGKKSSLAGGNPNLNLSTFQVAGLAAAIAVLATTILLQSFTSLRQWLPGHKPTAFSTVAPLSSTTDLAPNVKILTYDPLIIHISNFLSKSEREHLIKLGNPLLKKSTTINEDGSQSPSKDRTSSSAFLPETDPIVSAIAQRAADFQGFLDPAGIDMQVTSYAAGQEYKHHFDWYMEDGVQENRISTFFAILKSECDDCGTEFPLMNGTLITGKGERKKWCDFIDCQRERLTTRNLEGGALFWVNLDHKGNGQDAVLHAGLPANGGAKVGLNIWTTVKVAELKSKGLFRPWSDDFDGD